ncbi:aminotransferase class V-fold PLP-dependent enzyme [Marinibactrum halimedae]|uniref:Kynureninase n=1 Tax=Marinibactrum halimedae TaxID=1444977 RepID=A0AA37TA54_9GAMM|nr:aminotransferase class V-fold PLP-dependent enzyme [Marinibactrum halimedae]MCD9457991.1 aminotransferase class V-fold PLP-dependent enzyme [Marinibactrum halimedae]GLS27617.1 kynureninase [Marinibactrum halimedae]
MYSLEDFQQSPNPIAQHYGHAQVQLKLMFTGHVHQALPDVAESAYAEHWDCLNKQGDERFDIVFSKADQVREGFAGMIDAQAWNIALGSSVHDLFVRFLSCLPLQERSRIVTTNTEHPSLLRQLRRLEQEGIELVLVEGDPASESVEKLAAVINGKTAAVCVSSVNFQSGLQTLELDTLMPICQQHGAELFVDAYQSVNVLSFSVSDYNLQQAFVVGGGSKYCQMGNGVCFMHVPPDRNFEPIVTGWFGQFDPVLDNPAALPLAYADDATRFNGSTYDALPHFRAVHVFDYFLKQGLSPELLHDVNRYQLGVLARAFHAEDFDPAVIRLPHEVEYMGGFIAFKTPYAQKLYELIRDIGVVNDYRGDYLRLGPAPYLCEEQLRDAIVAMKEATDRLVV